MTSGEPARWKEAVVYQVYPRSFADSNDDGIGDLPGIVSKLDYIDELGADLVWLNPVYDSPMVDEGYDISDYRGIHDDYGTMDDWERLRDGLHDRDIGLLMDLVVNHTSVEHEWFRKSRRKKGKYDDYYIWREGDPLEPPNNWESFFGGSAWTYDYGRQAWYLHLFDETQADLDWSNPDVREDVYDMMRWWLEKDIDGYRMDVINMLSKPEELVDGDPNTEQAGLERYINGPRIHEYVREMHDRVLAEYDVVTVGETPHVTVEEARQFQEDGLDLVFPFQFRPIKKGDTGPWSIEDWTLDELRDVTSKWQRGRGEDTWNSLYLGNHDLPRMVSRFGNQGEFRRESAKMLATFIYTLRGTPFVYQGDEIGMTNPTFDALDEFRDVRTLKRVKNAFETGEIESFAEIREELNYWSRDNARTPMQWADEPNAGFTVGEPWIKVNGNYSTVNVAREEQDDESVLQYYRRLLALRKDSAPLEHGTYEVILEDHPEIFAYLRRADSERALVVLNFFDGTPTFELPAGVEYRDATLRIATDEGASDDPDAFDLRPYEARIYRLS